MTRLRPVWTMFDTDDSDEKYGVSNSINVVTRPVGRVKSKMDELHTWESTIINIENINLKKIVWAFSFL